MKKIIGMFILTILGSVWLGSLVAKHGVVVVIIAFLMFALLGLVIWLVVS